MYNDYWHFEEGPFENTPNPRFLFSSPQHQEGLSRLLYTVKEGKGAALLTGTYGCGKTLLGKTLLRELEKDVYSIAFLTNPRLDDVEMLRMMVYLLGGQEASTRKADLLMALEHIILSNHRDGHKTVIVVDEAHAIEDNSIFEELRLLLNYQTEDQFLLTLLLLGQPELKNKVESNKQLSQRIALRYHLQAMNATETANYIQHRLQVAGSKEAVFDPESFKLIYERSGGIPRRINQICDMALLTGMGRKATQVGPEIIREAIESLEN